MYTFVILRDRRGELDVHLDTTAVEATPLELQRHCDPPYICLTAPLTFSPERMPQALGDRLLGALLELKAPGIPMLLTRIFELGMEAQRQLDENLTPTVAA